MAGPARVRSRPSPPSPARGPSTIPAATNVAQIVISGTKRHTEGALSMPAFGNAYSDVEIAAVANYVTARFGSQGIAAHRAGCGGAAQADGAVDAAAGAGGVCEDFGSIFERVDRHCERQRSNPSTPRRKLDCFVAFAPRNDVKTSVGDLAARCARAMLESCPSMNKRAQGKPGARCTRGLACKMDRRAHTSIQVQRKQSGLPCAMVLRLITCSPR